MRVTPVHLLLALPVVAALAACSTTQTVPTKSEAAISSSQPDPDDGSAPYELGPQTLAVGVCGLFGWDRSAESRFVFFARPGTALYLSGDDPVQTLSSQDEFPATRYGKIQLELGPGEAMIDGVRYSQARIIEQLDDGFSRRQPLVILKTCQKPD